MKSMSRTQAKIHKSFILKHIFIKFITCRLLLFAITICNSFSLLLFICFQRIWIEVHINIENKIHQNICVY